MKQREKNNWSPIPIISTQELVSYCRVSEQLTGLVLERTNQSTKTNSKCALNNASTVEIIKSQRGAIIVNQRLAM